MMYPLSLQTRLDRFVAGTHAFGYLLTIVCSIDPIAIVWLAWHI
jgi:hypothetical protein